MKLYIKSSVTVSVACYIFCQDYVLASKRGSTAPSNPNKWNVPVGMIENGESPEDAMIREIWEETGLSLSPSMLIYAETQEWGDGIHNGINFIIRLKENPSQYHIGEGDGECSKYQWINVKDTDRFNWAYGMGNLIHKYYRGE